MYIIIIIIIIQGTTPKLEDTLPPPPPGGGMDASGAGGSVGRMMTEPAGESGGGGGYPPMPSSSSMPPPTAMGMGMGTGMGMGMGTGMGMGGSTPPGSTGGQQQPGSRLTSPAMMRGRRAYVDTFDTSQVFVASQNQSPSAHLLSSLPPGPVHMVCMSCSLFSSPPLPTSIPYCMLYVVYGVMCMCACVECAVHLCCYGV